VNRPLAILLVIAIAFMSADAQKKKSSTKNSGKPEPNASVPFPEPYRDLLGESQQLVLVTTPAWNKIDGTLRRFEKQDGTWRSVGESFPIVVGKSGLGWDGIIDPPSAKSFPIKKEGDGRSPAGIFKITDLFGFASSLDAKLSYTALIESTECVDDSNSSAYNQIVDRKQIPNPDWNSSEKMRTIDVYKLGAVVDYNSPKVPGSGSCIFLHIWKGPGHGTAGCTAMEESHVQELSSWLDESKHPVLVQLPAPTYQSVKQTWQLP
jgi:D-alanyl-D-alanine dipeptidase